MTARTLTAREYRDQLAATMTEAQLQAKVLQLAGTLGWLAYHTHDSRRSQPGFPDLVLAHPGQRRVLFRELKKQGGRVSVEQQRWADAITAGGLDFAFWRPADLLEERVLRDLQGA